MNTLLSRAAALLIASAAWVAPAAATTIVPLTVDQMTDAADAVVRGTVTDVWTVKVDRYVWTRAELEIERVYKGQIESETITLESMGGTYDGQVQVTPGAARYSVGEEVFAFVTTHPSRGTWGTVAMSHGKFTVRQNPADATDMVVRFTVPHDQAYDARFVPAPPRDQRVSLSSIEAAVLARVELGWDGQPIPGISNEKLRSINRLQPGVR